jgi:hypothetical protein
MNRVDLVGERLPNTLYRVAGTGFLGLAWLKHKVQGYRTPRPFALDDAEQCIAYDWSVVEGWRDALREYCSTTEPFRGRDILELGPGADLGVAGFLLALGAASYRAADANPLLAAPPGGFYAPLTRRVALLTNQADASAIADELERAHAERGQRISWEWRPDFDLDAMVRPRSADLIVSQAAFEHFDDVRKTCAQLARAARPNAVLVAEIDLMTHSRWIRDRDPLNIYRHSDGLYRLLRFHGIPNRLRPSDYMAALHASGWIDIRVTHKETLGHEQLQKVRPHLQRRWRGDDADMRALSIVVLARRRDA